MVLLVPFCLMTIGFKAAVVAAVDTVSVSMSISCGRVVVVALESLAVLSRALLTPFVALLLLMLFARSSSSSHGSYSPMTLLLPPFILSA